MNYVQKSTVIPSHRYTMIHIDPQRSTENDTLSDTDTPNFQVVNSMIPQQPRPWQTCPESCCSFSRVRRAMWECWLWIWLLQCRQCGHSMAFYDFYIFLCYWTHWIFISFHTHDAAYNAAYVGNVSAWMSVLTAFSRVFFRGVPDLSTLSVRSLFCSQQTTMGNGGNASLCFTCSHWGGDRGTEFQTKARPRCIDIESIERNQCFDRVVSISFNICAIHIYSSTNMIKHDQPLFQLIQTDSCSLYDSSCFWGNCAPWEQFLAFCSNLVHRELLRGDEG